MDAPTVEGINRTRQLLVSWYAAGDGQRLAEAVADARIRPEIRMWTMHLLKGLNLRGFPDDHVLVAALVVALADSNPWVRREAARALFAAPDRWDLREAVPVLRRLLSEPHESVRLAAAITLSAVGDRAAREALIEFAHHATPLNRRLSAVAALARLRAPEGEVALHTYLADKENSEWAAGWLEEMGTPSSIAPLKRARRRHPFSRRDYTAAIRAIEHRRAEQTRPSK